MTQLSLKEFQRLTGVPNDTLIHLLDAGELSCSVRPGGGVVIDTAGFDLDAVIGAILDHREETRGEHREILVARVGRILAEELDRLAMDISERLTDIAAHEASCTEHEDSS